ncbi:hypothetical protein B0H10DRAFT_2218717 [Mycena sp. CBHHK59/15]|nr:hypothetical protein B0H10DRAFT_2203188 [Mycena sp. CBHHK59/15]KAJ6575921.1 hypothetical protein B0H10DRAFT_2236624 [Mycena sp. CBHHK59/15]KAJ6617231.1 hypothetical protein B0H10DRAFT_2218717 [Mycena sp. CBHHK59/15]
MSTTHSAAPNASTPQQELDALVAKVAALARLSVDLTRLSLDIQDTFPAVMMQVAAMSAASAPTVVRGVPQTPDEVEAAHPPSPNDPQSWYVVIVGREPGLYTNSDAADMQTTGIPNQFRQRKTGLREALAFYRNKYEAGKVEKWN